MSIVVMKFGGTSVADTDRIRAAAQRAIQTRRRGHQVVMVVSAMGDTTDHLLDLAGRINPDPPKRELDQLLATGEQVTISLVAMALEALGAKAISFTAGQVGLITDDIHTKARIQTVDVHRIRQQLDAGRIVIVAGFQGVTEDGAVTTLGRGGSNVSLVAIAAALGAEVCENYTDVDGIYTADPRIVPMPGRSTASATTRCWSWRRWAPRCSRTARWSSPRNTTCPSTSAAACTTVKER